MGQPGRSEEESVRLNLMDRRDAPGCKTLYNFLICSPTCYTSCSPHTSQFVWVNNMLRRATTQLYSFPCYLLRGNRCPQNTLLKCAISSSSFGGREPSFKPTQRYALIPCLHIETSVTPIEKSTGSLIISYISFRIINFPQLFRIWSLRVIEWRVNVDV
jgi:hypothetical protein